MYRLLVLLGCFALVACDRITGADTQKILDAEAIGYACRISQKTPGDCMKEYEAQSPASVLDGWKAADKDIAGKAIDPSMGKSPPESAQSVSAVTDASTAAGEDEKPVAAPKSEPKNKSEAKSKASH